MDHEKATCDHDPSASNSFPLDRSYSLSLSPTRSIHDHQTTPVIQPARHVHGLEEEEGPHEKRPALRPRALSQFWQSVRSHLLPPLSLSSNTELSDWYDEEASTSEPKPGYFTSSSRPSRQASTNSTTKKDVEPVHVVVLDRSFKDLLGDQAGVTPSGRSSGDLGGTTPTAEPPNDDYLLRRGVSDLLSSPSTTSLCQPDTTPVRSFLSDYRRFPHHARQFVCKTLPLTVWDFFESHFDEAKVERAYRRETWAMSKPQAITAAVFLSIAWLVTVATQAQPLSTFVKIAYCGVGVASIAPVIPMVAFNGPQRWPWTWQIVLFVATWTLPYVIVFDLWNCHFYGPGPNRCPQKDFIGIYYFVLAFPTFSLFMLQGTRAFHTLGALVWVGIVGGLVVPRHIQFIRDLISTLLFHVAIGFASFLKEKSDRRMFSLREQLKSSYKATQRAQVAERSLSETKKRFVSYIFHEVRVPLNSSLLAYQNLLGEKVFDSGSSEQKDLVMGLSSSLFTMEKVLNDLLDFNKMEAGKLTWSHRPFHLHASFRALLLAFRGVASARNIEIVTDFDPAIDAFSPLLLGDSMRLSQVISNLISNASKFTENGKITCVTKLLHPIAPEHSTSHRRLQSDVTLKLQRTDIAIVRIEIRDTGVGIHADDLTESRLFSPYHQTSAGLAQTGKGSGLGLALVRKIVKLSGGRLGVQSAPGQGSTFWVELPFGRATNSGSFGENSRPSSATGGKRDSLSVPVPSSEPTTSMDGLDRPELSAQQDVKRVPGGPSEVLAPPTPVSASDARVPSSRLNILVADDDPLTRRLMTRMLTRLDHNVRLAEDGLEALTILREAWKEKDECRFDAILLDNQMPNMTGVECAREMRRIGLRTYVCGITGNALLSDQNEFMSAGADKVLTKPVLERSIREALLLAKDRAEQIQKSAKTPPAAESRTDNTPSSPGRPRASITIQDPAEVQ